MSEDENGRPRPSRRDFLKIAAGVGGGVIAAKVEQDIGLIGRIGNFLSKKAREKMEQDDIAGQMGQKAAEEMRKRDLRDQLKAQQAEDAKKESDAIRKALGQDTPR